MAENLPDAIQENATGPKRARGDAGEMEQHPLPDQIAADRYLEGKRATRKKGLGLSLKKLSPPGAE